MEKTKVSVQESGRRGGEANAANHDTPYFQELGKSGGEATRDKYGAAHYQALGKKGGRVKPKRDAG